MKPAHMPCREIFVPTGIPYHSFYDRKRLSNQIVQYLTMPGNRIMAVSGLSRTGKTNLVRDSINQANNVLEERNQKQYTTIQLNGASIKSFDDLRNNIEKELGLGTRQIETTKGGGIQAWFAQLTGQRKITEEDSVTSTELVKEMGNKVIVIDDFHRIPKHAKSEILRHLKEYSERADFIENEGQAIDFRFIIIYIPTLDTMNYRFASDLNGKVEPIEIPLWTNDELVGITEGHIVEHGSVVLGLKKLATESYGLPSVMQRFCLIYCEQNMERKDGGVSIIRDHELLPVFQEAGNQLWSLFGDSIYRELIAINGRQHPEQVDILSSKIDNRSGDIYKMIWYAISASNLPNEIEEKLPAFIIEHKLEMSIENIVKRLEILTDIEEANVDYIRPFIRKMSDEAKISYSNQTEKDFEPGDPLFEYLGESDSLVIYDPQIIVSLSHSDKHLKKFTFPSP